MDTDERAERNLRWVRGLLGYLVVVVGVHGLTVYAGKVDGGLEIVAIWFFLAIPLFIPGFVIGAYFLCTGIVRPASYRVLRIALGAMAIALPVYEWHLLGVLPSGWRGSEHGESRFVEVEAELGKVTPNNPFERTVRHRGTRLAAARSSWPAAQLGR